MNVKQLREHLDDYADNTTVVISDGNMHYDLEVVEGSVRMEPRVILLLTDLPEEDE